mgnify:CR=1 FL=1|jgi:MFS family permease
MLHDEQLNSKKIKLINFISFLIGFSQATVVYVFSTYFKDSSGTENVGIFYFVAYLFVLIFLLNLHKAVRKLGKSNVFYFSILAKIVVMVFLILLPPSWYSIPFLALYMVLVALIWTSLDVILESFSADKVSGRVRGLHLTIFNAGFLLGPLVSSQLMSNIGFSGIFLFSLVVDAFVLVFSLIGFRNVNHVFKQKLGVIEVIRKVFKRKDVMRIYWVSFALEFFYALMIIYTPIYLLDLGMSWQQIGLIFTLMLLPFVLIQYPAGILADKKMGEKELIIFAIVFMVLATLSVFFLNSMSVLVWGSVLFATRIGAALVEILRDSYFYKRIDGHDVDLINFFRTATPLGYIMAAIFSSVLLFFLPLKFVFILIALILFLSLYQAIKLDDNKCEKEIVKEGE